MASSLFSNPQQFPQQIPQQSPQQQMQQRYQAAMNFLKGQNPETLFQDMMQNNQQFRQFYEQNKGKTFAQIAQEHGADPSMFGLR